MLLPIPNVFVVFLMPLHKKWSFPWRISSVNVTKSAGNCRFSRIYRKKPSWKTSYFVQCTPLIWKVVKALSTWLSTRTTFWNINESFKRFPAYLKSFMPFFFDNFSRSKISYEYLFVPCFTEYFLTDLLLFITFLTLFCIF